MFLLCFFTTNIWSQKEQIKKVAERGEKTSQYIGVMGMPIGELNPVDKRNVYVYFASQDMNLNAGDKVKIVIDKVWVIEKKVSFFAFLSGLKIKNIYSY